VASPDLGTSIESYPASPPVSTSPPPLTQGDPALVGPTATSLPAVTDLTPYVVANSQGPTFDDDIPEHLTAGDGFSQKGGISGAHNQDEFNEQVTENDVKIVSQTPGSVNGLTVINYQIPALDSAGNQLVDADGNTIYKSNVFTKTVYDPTVISDQTMVDLGQQAAVSGYQAAVASGNRIYTSQAGGINFTVYINSATGNISNYHPK
jgi:filamentous hemagglutinin